VVILAGSTADLLYRNTSLVGVLRYIKHMGKIYSTLATKEEENFNTMV
jgi:hypothetical protein